MVKGMKNQHRFNFLGRACALPAAVLILAGALLPLVSCDLFPRENPDDPKSGKYRIYRDIDVYQDGAEVIHGSIFDYGSLETGTDRDIIFSINNLEGEDMSLTGTPAVSVTGDDADDFVVVSQPSSVTVPPVTYFTLRFSPSSQGAKTALVTIPNDSPDEGVFSFTVTGWGTRTATVDPSAGVFPAIAVDGSSVYIVYVDQANTDLKCAVSADNGATWPSGTIYTVDSGDVNTCSPDLVVDDNGYLYVSYNVDVGSNTANIRFSRSEDSAENWTTSSGIDSVKVGRNSSIAVDGNNVYVAYSYINMTSYMASLKFNNSSDSGDTWSTAQTLDGSGSNDTGYYQALAAGDGSVYLSYSKNYTGYCFGRSEDSGTTWDPGFSTISSSWGMGDFALSGTNVYIAKPLSDEFMLYRSTDSGDTWPAGLQFTIDMVSAVGVSLAVDGSNVYVSYLTMVESSSYNLWFARSTDNGANWPEEDRILIDSTGNISTSSSYSSIAANGQRIYIAYYDGINGDLKVARSLDSGATW